MTKWILALFIPFQLLSTQTNAYRYPHSGEYKLERIDPNIYVMLNLYHPSPQGGVNSVFMATNTSLIFIDAGMNTDSAEAVWDEATRIFPGRSKLYLILTHFHCDHVFGMNYLKIKGATVIGHKYIDPWLDQNKFVERLKKATGKTMTFVDVMSLENYKSPEEAKKILGDVKLSPPDLFIEGDEVLQLGDLNLNLYYVPGHTTDLIVVYEPKSQTLVASDLIYSRIEPYLHDKTREGCEAWINSLSRISSLPIKKIIPGHGPVCEKSMIGKNIQSLQEQARNLK